MTSLNAEQTPPRRRRRGACDGCKQSKVRCDGETPCAYCERYSRACYYTSTARRQRAKSSSGSIVTNFTSEDGHTRSPSLITSPLDLNHDFGQHRLLDLSPMNGFEILKDLLVPAGDQGNGIMDRFDPWSLPWDIAMATDLGYTADGEDTTNSQPCSCSSRATHELLPTSSSWTAGSRSTSTTFGYYDYSNSDPMAHNVDPYGLIDEHEVSDEERSAVKAAMIKLRCFWRDDPFNQDPALDSRAPPRHVRDLLSDKEWINTSLEAAFDIHTGLGDFLSELEIKGLADTLLINNSSESLSAALVLGVIATGRHVLESRSVSSLNDQSQSRQVFAEACNRISSFLLRHNSLLKLQALTTLAIMSLRSRGSRTLDLVSSVGVCARTLYASHMSPSKGELLENNVNVYNLNLALGAAYCVTHQFEVEINIAGKALYDGHLTMPNNGGVLEIPRATDGEDSRTLWMASQIDMGKLCSRLTKVHRNETNTLRLENELQSWRRNLPAHYHDIDQSYPLNLATDTRKLWLFCQYHEASLYIHSGHPDDAATHVGTDHNHTSRSVKTVLEAASVLPPDAVHSHRKIYELVSLATYFCFTAVLRDPNGAAESNLPYLGMACGFFAKLITMKETSFTAAACLLRVAQQIYDMSKSRRTKLNRELQRRTKNQYELYPVIDVIF